MEERRADLFLSGYITLHVLRVRNLDVHSSTERCETRFAQLATRRPRELQRREQVLSRILLLRE